VAAGRTVRLDCLVTGSPSPAVYWTREEGRLIWWLTGPPGAATGLPELAEISSNNSSSFHNISTVTNNNNSYMARNRSLVIANATRANSGHYFCVGVNTAGAAMERSHLLVYDEQDFVRPRPTTGTANSSSADAAVDDQYYHVRPDPELASARAALMERTVAVAGLYADSPTSLRISWRLEAAAPQQQQYLEGYYIYYREAAAAAASSAASVASALTSVKVLHAGATSYSLNRLRVHTEYEVFIAPFYKSVLGLPSASRLARTSEDWPSAAPRLTNLSLAGGGGGGYLSVAWLPLDAEKANGMLAGYRLRIASSSLGGKGEAEATTLVVSPSETVARIDLNSLQLTGPNGGGGSSGLVTLSVEVAALNSVGQGPFSPPASLQLDLDQLLRQRKEAANSGDGSSSSYGEEDFTQGIALDASPAWVGALIGSALLVIVLIGGAILTYRRRLQQAGKMPPPVGHHHHHHHLAYLEKLLKKPAAATRRDVSHGGGLAAADDRKEQEIVSSSSLWIDRRWTAAEDCPGGCAGNNTLDRRLLGGGGGQPVENEYTYIDRTKLATFAAAAAAAATGGGHYSQSRGGESAGCGGYGGESAGYGGGGYGGGGYGGGGRDHLDLAPYASTDILREEALGSAAFYSTRYLVSFINTE
jgi:hypothetical protein